MNSQKLAMVAVSLPVNQVMKRSELDFHFQNSSFPTEDVADVDEETLIQ